MVVGGSYLVLYNPLFPPRHRIRSWIGPPTTATRTRGSGSRKGSSMIVVAAANGISELLHKARPQWMLPLFPLTVQPTPTPQLALLSLLFVLSMAVGALFLLAVISIPTMSAFRKLGVSMDKLIQVARQEVPATLFSLKLSGLEINHLTQQLTNLSHNVSANHHGNNYRKQ